MRKTMTAMFLALAPAGGLALAAAAPAQAQQVQVSASLFYDQLGQYGRWVQVPQWGWVWYPTAVAADWRPYTQGRWMWTDQYGWYWASYEPFGWATDHYGRWGYDESYGWVWVPGDRWAPAWVAFRYSDQRIGWAPLPPDTLNASAAVQVDDAVLTAAYYQPRWVFVDTRYFVSPEPWRYAAAPDRNGAYIRGTRNVTNIRVQGGVFINRAFEPDRIRRAVGHDIPHVRVQAVQTYRNVDIDRHKQADVTVINVYNPRVTVDRNHAPPARFRAQRTDHPRVTVHPQLVRPEDRREHRAAPPPAGTAGPEHRAAPPDHSAPDHSAPDHAAPDHTPPDRGQPNHGQPNRGSDRGHQDDHAKPPGKPGPDRANPEHRPEIRRGTPPAHEAAPHQPPPRDEHRAQPQQEHQRQEDRAQPPRHAPGAPPSREPQQRREPHAAPQHGQPPAGHAPDKKKKDEHGR
jgi:hypothetical protein